MFEGIGLCWLSDLIGVGLGLVLSRSFYQGKKREGIWQIYIVHFLFRNRFWIISWKWRIFYVKLISYSQLTVWKFQNISEKYSAS